MSGPENLDLLNVGLTYSTFYRRALSVPQCIDDHSVHILLVQMMMASILQLIYMPIWRIRSNTYLGITMI